MTTPVHHREIQMDNNGFTYRTGKLAMLTMEARGWTHTATVIHNHASKSPRFGMLYTKGDKEFWLNKNTYQNLPE